MKETDYLISIIGFNIDPVIVQDYTLTLKDSQEIIREMIF